ANANRAREALRVMEDIARFGLDDGALAAELKGIRHDLRAALGGIGFDAEVLLAWRDTPGDVGTTITTEGESRRDGMGDIAGAADCLQLREKSLPDRELLARATRLVAIARACARPAPPAARPSVIINDRPDIALLAGADGVHIGQDDLSVLGVRRVVGAALM